MSLTEKIDYLLSKIRELRRTLSYSSITLSISSFLDKYGNLGELLESYYALERARYTDLSIDEKMQFLLQRIHDVKEEREEAISKKNYAIAQIRKEISTKRDDLSARRRELFDKEDSLNYFFNSSACSHKGNSRAEALENFFSAFLSKLDNEIDWLFTKFTKLDEEIYDNSLSLEEKKTYFYKRIGYLEDELSNEEHINDYGQNEFNYEQNKKNRKTLDNLKIIHSYLEKEIKINGKREQERKELEYKQELERKEKEKYWNDDMWKIQEVLASIPTKIQAIESFNKQLLSSMDMYAEKGYKIIQISYGRVLRPNELVFTKEKDNYQLIKDTYSNKINPTIVLACDATVKKILNLIIQKTKILFSNIDDQKKYKGLMVKLKKQFDDELTLQKIKEINNDVNLQIDSNDDYEQRAIKHTEVQKIIENINEIDSKVQARRDYEIQFGQLEI